MILDAFKLEGKVALVTGGSRGIGHAIAMGLAEAGADVVVLDRLECTETQQAIQHYGRRCVDIRCELEGLDSHTASRVVADCLAEFGRLDVLVNNAGIIRRSPALEFSEKDWVAVLQVNLTSAFLLSQAAARHFETQGTGGKIINVCSMLSFQGGVNAVAYTAAKSGLAGLTRALSNEWARNRINVNAIAPGYLSTEVTAGLRSDPTRSEDVLRRIPAGRWGEPKDVQGAVVFLASEASSYVHGAILPVDGGWLAW